MALKPGQSSKECTVSQRGQAGCFDAETRVRLSVTGEQGIRRRYEPQMIATLASKTLNMTATRPNLCSSSADTLSKRLSK